MTILTEGTRKAEFIVSEANDWRSRDEVTLTVPAAGVASGTIVAVAAGVATIDPVAGSEAGIVFATFAGDFGTVINAGDYPATIIARDAEVSASELTYLAGADAAAQLATNGVLASLGIIVR